MPSVSSNQKLACRESHTAVIVGDHMVVFGGHGDPGEEEIQVLSGAGLMCAVHPAM